MQDADRGAGRVVDHVGDVAGAVQAGQRELGQLDQDGVRREQREPDGHEQPDGPPPARGHHDQQHPARDEHQRVEQPLTAREDPEPVRRRPADVPRAVVEAALGRDDPRRPVRRQQGDQAEHHQRPDEQAQRHRPGPAGPAAYHQREPQAGQPAGEDAEQHGADASDREHGLDGTWRAAAGLVTHRPRFYRPGRTGWMKRGRCVTCSGPALRPRRRSPAEVEGLADQPIGQLWAEHGDGVGVLTLQPLLGLGAVRREVVGEEDLGHAQPDVAEIALAALLLPRDLGRRLRGNATVRDRDELDLALDLEQVAPDAQVTPDHPTVAEASWELKIQRRRDRGRRPGSGPASPPRTRPGDRRTPTAARTRVT